VNKRVEIIEEKVQSNYFEEFIVLLFMNAFLCFWGFFLLTIGSFFFKFTDYFDLLGAFLIISLIATLIIDCLIIAYNLCEKKVIKKSRIVTIKEVSKGGKGKNQV